MRRAAALCAWAAGLGFGIPGAIGTVHLARKGDVWTFLGFPTYGDGPLDRMGVPTTVPLMSAYVGVCAAEVVLGGLLWRGARRAPLASHALLPVESVFWIGFALPLGPVFGVARTAFVLLSAKSEHAQGR